MGQGLRSDDAWKAAFLTVPLPSLSALKTSRPLFRRIRKGGHLGEPLAPAAVRDIVKERCTLAGVQGKFSAHSLRAGFVTEAGKQNMSLPETMAMTGHHSVATVMGYFRAESSLGSKASRMLDED